MPSYAWYSGTLRDGRITTRLDVASGSWQVVMDDAGPLSCVLPLADKDVAAVNPYLTAEPARCFLAVAYIDDEGTETFLAGGPVWTHGYDGPSKLLTIGAAGVWSYYDHRKVLPVLAAGVNPASVTTAYTSSLGTIAKKLVQLAHTHTAGSLPIVFPADEGGTNVRTYRGFEMNNTGQILRDLTSVDGGPEIQFIPRRRADDARYLEWVMRVGTTANPLLTQLGVDWSWDTSTEKSSVSSISVARDGSSMVTRVWQQGPGTDLGTTFGRADSAVLTAAGFPLLEGQGPGDQNAPSQATLDDEALGLLRAGGRPTETWNVKVRRDDAPNVAQYAVGDWVRFTIGGVDADGNRKQPYLPEGDYRTRVTAIGGDDSLDVSLGLAPTLGGV